MGKEYKTEDGHIFTKEDFDVYAIWKIQDLKSQGYLKDEVILFDDNDLWQEFIKQQLGKDERNI